jgi:16S rRNA C967 or C1407 C5-methylase (RsmB/RsmF family)/NOL1/NOP2/fmu family ribosome biogenesis protein
MNRIKAQFPADFDQFIRSLDQIPAVSVRINPRKFRFQTDKKNVPWCETGLYLSERPSFTLDPIFHSGAYYVQEASSMFLEQAFKQIESGTNRIVLDLCASPGGKSTHLLSMIDDTDLLVANEVIRSRVSVLDENLRKWGHQNLVVCSNDPSDFSSLEGLFDVIVVDAPCSGEGLFRRDASAISQWSVENTAMCSTRQRRILTDSWAALKTGGYLIYSTCTFNPAENEENLCWLAEKYEFESIRIPLKDVWGIDELITNGLYAYRFLPHRVRGEGFFITLLRKKEQTEPIRLSRKAKINFEKMPKQFTSVKNWLLTNNSEILLKNETLTAFPEDKMQVFDTLFSHLRIISFGLPLAKIKNNDLLPEHAFALSIDRNPDIFQTEELDLLQSLRYQKKEEIRIQTQTKGWILVSYNGVQLGFVKNLGNRANNYFPKEWRIRMTLPDLPKPWYLED